MPRPSRTQQLLDPKLRPQLTNNTPDAFQKKYVHPPLQPRYEGCKICVFLGGSDHVLAAGPASPMQSWPRRLPNGRRSKRPCRTPTRAPSLTMAARPRLTAAGVIAPRGGGDHAHTNPSLRPLRGLHPRHQDERRSLQSAKGLGLQGDVLAPHALPGATLAATT